MIDDLLLVLLHKGSFDSDGAGGGGILLILLIGVLILAGYLLSFVAAILLAIFLHIKNAMGDLFKPTVLAIAGICITIGLGWLAMKIVNSPNNQLNRFDKVVLSSVVAETKENYCFEGYRFGMSRSEYYQHTQELIAAGLVEYDSVDGYLYLGFDNQENNYCKLSIVPSFYNGEELYFIKFSLYKGCDDAIKDTIYHRVNHHGWKRAIVPTFSFKNGKVRFPVFIKNAFDNNAPYEEGDEVFIKDNMMIVIRHYSVEFYNMPLYNKSKKRHYQQI